ncbi:selenocysteine-specific translation elongation factor [Lichenicola sp.]|uniref:selenocysteine-specific translation elongation factor n=1 Tax=Lichenicola sp. TaxID=2804529 RepID=UPI003B007A2D
MRRLLLGVIGHVDHGKTALVRALTGIETDRLPEEQRRGISIALGFAHLRLDGPGGGEPRGEIDIIDMPGHERFVRTMVSGATGIDAVLLVVAANEGVMPQTVEHVDIAVLLGLRRAIIVLTKADLVSPDEAAMAAEEIAAFAAKAGLRPVGPPLLTSVVSGDGIDAVRDALRGLASVATREDDSGFAYLPVDRAFTIAGHGTVVTGTLRRGRLTTTTPMELVPGGEPARLRLLQVHGRMVPAAEPGQRVAVNLRGLEPGEVPRGMALCEPGLLTLADWLTVEITSVPGSAPLPTTTRLQLLIGTDEIEVRLRLLDRDLLAPGQTALAQLHCTRPVAVPARERFILRTASPASTVAGGRVLDPTAQRLRRHAPRSIERLQALADATGDRILIEALDTVGGGGLTVPQLARLAGLSPTRIIQRLAADAPGAGLDVVRTRSGGMVGRVVFDKLVAALPRLLAARTAGHPNGMSRERLAALVPAASGFVLDEAVARLVAAGALRQEGGLVRIARPAQEQATAQAEGALAERLAEAIRRGGLTPPDMPDSDIQGRRMLDRLAKAGIIVRTHDRVQKRDVLFHRDAVEQARRVLAPLLRSGEGLLVKEAGLALGISRKFSVPLLEYLDTIQFTRRVGDRRVLGASIQG